MLADRFNIIKLKNLAYSKAGTILRRWRVDDESELGAVMEAVAYGFRNLALSVRNVRCSSDYLDSKEKLLVLMARYISWARDSFQQNATFIGLLEECPQFAVALVISSGAALVPPWFDPHTDRLISCDSTTHILSRYCSACSFRGVMYIYCTNCKNYDYEIGLQVGRPAVGGIVEGTERLSGDQRDFTYTCMWCQSQHHCNGKWENFTNPWTGKESHGRTNMNPLICRRCNTFGCMGKMRMP